jgi:hypothetical protein
MSFYGVYTAPLGPAGPGDSWSPAELQRRCRASSLANPALGARSGTPPDSCANGVGTWYVQSDAAGCGATWDPASIGTAGAEFSIIPGDPASPDTAIASTVYQLTIRDASLLGKTPADIAAAAGAQPAPAGLLTPAGVPFPAAPPSSVALTTNPDGTVAAQGQWVVEDPSNLAWNYGARAPSCLNGQPESVMSLLGVDSTRLTMAIGERIAGYAAKVPLPGGAPPYWIDVVGTDSQSRLPPGIFGRWKQGVQGTCPSVTATFSKTGCTDGQASIVARLAPGTGALAPANITPAQAAALTFENPKWEANIGSGALATAFDRQYTAGARGAVAWDPTSSPPAYTYTLPPVADQGCAAPVWGPVQRAPLCVSQIPTAAGANSVPGRGTSSMAGPTLVLVDGRPADRLRMWWGALPWWGRLLIVLLVVAVVAAAVGAIAGGAPAKTGGAGAAAFELAVNG